MSSDWRRAFGNVRSFVGNSMGGLRGGSNLASWVVAGTLAYFLWVKPAQELKREQQERAALAATADPYRYIEKRKPIPDPQVISVSFFLHLFACWVCSMRSYFGGFCTIAIANWVVGLAGLIAGWWLDIWQEEQS